MALSPQVMLQLEKKLFDYFNQDVFRDDNGTAVSPAADTPGTAPAVTARGLAGVARGIGAASAWLPGPPHLSRRRLWAWPPDPPGSIPPPTAASLLLREPPAPPPVPQPGAQQGPCHPPTLHWPRAEPPPSPEHRGYVPHEHPEHPPSPAPSSGDPPLRAHCHLTAQGALGPGKRTVPCALARGT